MYIINTFKSKTYKIISITELVSLDITTFIGIRCLLLVILVIYLIYKNKSNLYTNFYVFSIFIISLLSLRHTSLMYLMTLSILSYSNIKIDIKSEYKSVICNFISICLTFTGILLLPYSKDIRSDYIDITNVIENKDALIYNSDMDVGGYFEYNGYTKMSLDSRCEAFSKEISGIDNIIRNYTAISKGYLIEDDFSYTIPTDEYILGLVEDYDYVISGKLQYFNRIALKNNWIELYKDQSYVIWKNPK